MLSGVFVRVGFLLACCGLLGGCFHLLSGARPNWVIVNVLQLKRNKVIEHVNLFSPRTEGDAYSFRCKIRLKIRYDR